MRWLVTGGAGFIGANLIAKLLKDDQDNTRVCVLDNFSGSSFEEFSQTLPHGSTERVALDSSIWSGASPVKIIEADIADFDALKRTSSGADIIVHLAANTGVAPSVANPRADCEANVLGTLNCLEAARANKVQRFVFASSGAPAGLCEPPITEDVSPRPASPYGASKLAGEAYCCAYANTFGIETVALRFSNVYGPHSWRKGSAVATFIRKAFAREPITINGDGSQTRDFIYVGDLVEAVVKAARKPGLKGELFQIATGKETSVNDLIDILRTKMLKLGGLELQVRHGQRSAADVLRNYADATKAFRILGWKPKTALEEGLDDTLRWFADLNR